MDGLESVLYAAFPGSRLLRAVKLGGGISSGATRCTLELPGGLVRELVVRRPSALVPGTNQSMAPVEARALPLARAAGVPVPALEFFDAATNTLVLEYVPGNTEFAPADVEPMLRAMAEVLVAIHGVSAEQFELSFLTHRRESAARMITEPPPVLDESLEEAALRSTLRALWPWPDTNASVLLHNDYWPGNILWNEGRITAVLDWEGVDVGDPVADVAIARLDLAWAFGFDAAEAFTRAYAERTQLDWSFLPHWDLWVALRPMSELTRWASAYATPAINRPDIDEPHMRRVHAEFVKKALLRINCAAAEPR